VITLAIGMFPVERSAVKYSLPLAVVGWFFALYHTLLYEGVIPESLQPCRQGVSCTEEYIELLGFVSIPMLSLIAFTIIIALLFTLKRRLSQ
jgi:disulfide bond formation protein DsbB